MVALFLIGTSAYVDRNVIGVLLEQIKLEFDVSDTALGMLSGLAFALLYATLGIPIARWVDHGNRKTIITLSLAIWSTMTLICGIATSFWQLLVARFGVGAGEAGTMPAVQSLIGDYYAVTERARAIGIFALSSSVGYAVGLIAGGHITEGYGWRATFIFFGIANIPLAIISYILLRDPRSKSTRSAPALKSSFFDDFRALFAKKSFRYLLSGTTAYFVMAYGALVFIVSLMIRIHGMSVSQAGTLFGIIFAVGSVIGSLGGGIIIDGLARRSVKWLPGSAALTMLIAVPVFQTAFWTSNIYLMSGLLVVGTMAISACSPATFSSIHVVCGSRRRGLAIAIVYLFANLIGLGLGPVLTGILSDHLAIELGQAEGLRAALMIMMSVMIPGAILMALATNSLKGDAED